MTAADIIKLIRDSLEPYVAAKQGSVSIAKDPFHVLELLLLTPDGFLVVVHFAGDDDLGQSRYTGVIKLKLEVFVSQQRGLAAEPGSELVGPTEGEDPLYVLIAKVRAFIRTIEFPDDGTTSGTIWYKGSEPVAGPEGATFNAYRLRFEINGAVSEET